MSAGEFGFFLGVAPGVCYTLWNLVSGQRVLNEAQLIAQAHGEVLDLASAPSLRFNYFFRPQQFIRPDDSDGMCQAKSRLLSVRKQFLRRHVVGGLMVLLGGLLGVAISLGLAPGP